MQKEEFKFYLHEYTRQELKRHTRSKKWFTITDKKFIENLSNCDKLPQYIRIVPTGYEIDISSCTYEELTPEIQTIYSNLANILDYIETYSAKEKKTYTINQQAEIIYEDWLSKNPRVSNQKYITTFKKLPHGLQAFLKFASATNKKITKASFTYSFANSAKELLDDIETYSLRSGKYAYFEFLGCKFYSHIDNADSVYLKLTGLTQSEYEQAVRNTKLHAKTSLHEQYNCLFSVSGAKSSTQRSLCVDIINIFESGKSDQEIFNELSKIENRIKHYHLDNRDLDAYMLLLSKTYICDTSPIYKKATSKFRTLCFPYNSTELQEQRQEAKEIAKEYGIEK